MFNTNFDTFAIHIPTMRQLSVVIITLNEERNIARCLDSVKGIADDVVVVDSFSKDKTREIAIAKGARFIEQQFLGHIEQKNYAITQAKYPFILSLDADEALSEELKASILQVKQSANSFDGYYMNRRTNYCGQWIMHCGWYPDKKLRLWDSTKGSWKGLNPHDKYEMTDPKSITGFLKGDILHYSYYAVEEHYLQAEKFSTIAAQVLFNAHRKTNRIHIGIKTLAKFTRNYFLKLGFLDGHYGFVICKIAAWETFLKYHKLNQLNKK